MSAKTYTGINIQYPISREILSGRKTIETRTYKIPQDYLGKTLLFVETPGPKGKFKARIVAKIIFSHCFRYSSKREFYEDVKKHLVTPDSLWAWKDEKPKWGWVISKLIHITPPKPVGKRVGIRYTKGISV